MWPRTGSVNITQNGGNLSPTPDLLNLRVHCNKKPSDLYALESLTCTGTEAQSYKAFLARGGCDFSLLEEERLFDENTTLQALKDVLWKVVPFEGKATYKIIVCLEEAPIDNCTDIIMLL